MYEALRETSAQSKTLRYNKRLHTEPQSNELELLMQPQCGSLEYVAHGNVFCHSDSWVTSMSCIAAQQSP